MQSKSMREQLDEAWNKATPKEEEETETVVEEEKEDAELEAGGPDKDAEKPAGDTEEKEEAKPEDSDKEPEKKAGGDEESGPKGKKSDKTDAGGDGDKGGAKKDAEGDLKAPVSWKPGVREHWKTIPKEAQAEIIRREREIDSGLQQAAAFRKVANEYFGVIKPYEHLIRAQNSTPAQAITNMLQTAARLVQGTKQQKAECIAEILANYDVDIPTLDNILSGKVKPGSDPDAKIVGMVEEKLKPILSFVDEIRGSREQATKKGEEEVAESLKTFSEDPKNEFFDDVRHDMADLMELAGNRGQAMTLQQAYDRACQMNDEVSKILAQRAARKNGELNGDKLLKKKKAASSIKGSPEEEPGTKKEGDDLRGSILQAMNDLEQQ